MNILNVNSSTSSPCPFEPFENRSLTLTQRIWRSIEVREAGEWKVFSLVQRLSPDLRAHILKNYFDLRDFAKVSLLSKSDNRRVAEEEFIWKILASRLNCPLKEGSAYYMQVMNYIKDVRQKAREIGLYSNDIKKIFNVKGPTIDQINHLQSWLQARSICCVWDQLVRQVYHIVGSEIDPGNPHNGRFALAKKFSAAFKNEKSSLNKIKKLDLSNLKLTIIPDEICELINLEELDLSNNYLRALPDQIGNLGQLKWITINGNKELASLPSELKREAIDVPFDTALPLNQRNIIIFRYNKGYTLMYLACMAIFGYVGNMTGVQYTAVSILGTGFLAVKYEPLFALCLISMAIGALAKLFF